MKSSKNAVLSESYRALPEALVPLFLNGVNASARKVSRPPQISSILELDAARLAERWWLSHRLGDMEFSLRGDGQKADPEPRA